ncbi:MAG: hypothetical protein E6G70_30195, partial [Alphaproteobacteria bacterium]
MLPYNRISAANYATTFALSRNPIWPDDSSSGGGGDCTNFISQALYAGGWEMVPGMKSDPTAWYAGRPFDYDRGNRSWTWAGADPFSRFLRMSGRASRCTVDDLAIGDLIQEYRFGQIIHTMLVTKITQKGTRKEVFLT